MNTAETTVFQSHATRVLTLALLLYPVLAPDARGQQLLEIDGIELRGEAQLVQSGGGTCNVLESDTAYEENQANHGAPRPRRPGEVFRDCDDCPEMVVLPGGGLAMGRYEVTVGKYGAFVAATGGGGTSWRELHSADPARHPMTVSWDEAQEYVSWLSQTAGATYRLPTDAEWERAAAGSQRGCDLDRTGNIGTCPVGSYGSNAAGLFDMVGNVWEWTEGCWEGDCGGRVLRGGSWSYGAEAQFPGARIWNPSPYRFHCYCGIRVARTLD